MEIFYASEFDGHILRLNEEESAHCVRVMRHRAGDEIDVIDGEGTLYHCRLTYASPKASEAEVISVVPDWGAHPYVLQMAVCPTKNADRYEWFAEKATELGVDIITPVIGDHSERKVFKTDRLKRILLSASKQSLKGAVPRVDEPVKLSDFIRSVSDASPSSSDPQVSSGYSASSVSSASSSSTDSSASLEFSASTDSSSDVKLIACCYEGDAPRISVHEALKNYRSQSIENSQKGSESPRTGNPCVGNSCIGNTRPDNSRIDSPHTGNPRKIIILIGPEGDFSHSEMALAEQCGFKPIHLGPSRLRTETAAVAAVAAVYFELNTI